MRNERKEKKNTIIMPDTKNCMKDYLDDAIRVLDHARQQESVPNVLFQKCAGALLLSGNEIGLGISSQICNGVAMRHNNNSCLSLNNRNNNALWSAPVAVKLSQFGLGAVIGRAHKDVLILLNQTAMERLLKGHHREFKIGLDLGFAVGKRGRSAGADLMASNAGLATSVVYTFSEGVMLSAQVETGNIVAVDCINEAFYGTSSPEEIFNGNAQVPECSAGRLVSKLHDKMMEHCEDNYGDEKKSHE